MNDAGDELFSGTGVALNQGYRIGIGDHANQIQNLLKRETSSHNLVDGAQFALHKSSSFYALLAAVLSGDPFANEWLAIHQRDVRCFAPISECDETFAETFLRDLEFSAVRSKPL